MKNANSHQQEEICADVDNYATVTVGQVTQAIEGIACRWNMASYVLMVRGQSVDLNEHDGPDSDVIGDVACIGSVMDDGDIVWEMKLSIISSRLVLFISMFDC